MAGPLPLFPLPDAVPFPGIKIPLHIFEPRYVQMIRNILDSHGRFIYGTLINEWEDNYFGTPDYADYACLVQVVDYKALADDRYNIIVESVSRVMITKEVESDFLYRQVEYEVRKFDLDHVTIDKEILMTMSAAFFEKNEAPDVAAKIIETFEIMKDKEILAYLCYILPLGVEQKVRILENDSPEQIEAFLMNWLSSAL